MDTDPGAEQADDEPSVAAAVVAGAAIAGATVSDHTNEDEPADSETADSDDSNRKDSDELVQDAVPVADTAAVAAGAAASGHINEDDTVDTETTDSAGSKADQTPLVVPPPPSAPFGSDDTGEFAFDAWTQPVEEEQGERSTAWLVPAGIAVAILAAVAFLVFSGNTSPSATTIAAVDTTIAPATTASPTSTSTTTTQASTTTVLAFPQPSDWPPVGEPIDTADLTLTQSAIGPIDVGLPIADVAGRLTASLGEATSSGVDGLCPPDESYWLQFGQLTATFDGFDASSVFVSYRYDEPQGTDPELGLETLSGIAIGDTVEDLINTYTQFTISFELIDSKDYFRLSDGGELLLWGPVSSVDPAGLIEGIYSPTACDTAP